MKITINENDINKPTKILYNLNEIIQGCDLKELNESNTELYINNKKYKYNKYFIPEKEGYYNIVLKFNFIIYIPSLSGLKYFLYLYFISLIYNSVFDSFNSFKLS